MVSKPPSQMETGKSRFIGIWWRRGSERLRTWGLQRGRLRGHRGIIGDQDRCPHPGAREPLRCPVAAPAAGALRLRLSEAVRLEGTSWGAFRGSRGGNSPPAPRAGAAGPLRAPGRGPPSTRKLPAEGALATNSDVIKTEIFIYCESGLERR